MTDSPDTHPETSQSQRLALPMTQPRVTYGLLIINVLVFLAMTAIGRLNNSDMLVPFGANASVLVAQGQVWRLLTSIFLHVGPMHLFFNSYALFIFGVEVERVYGSARFLAIYLLAGLYGSLVSFAFGPSLAVSAGASGAIFGLMGVMVAYFRRHRETFGEWGRQRLVSLLVVAGFNLMLGFTVPRIDNLAHMGGLIAGVVLGWLLVPEYELRVDERGLPYVSDRTSLRSRWWVIALAILLLIAGTSVAVSAQRESASAFILRGQQALEDGDFTTAESLFRQAVTRHPDSAEAHLNLALAYIALNRPADAIAELEAFIALRPDSPGADQARAFIDELRASVP